MTSAVKLAFSELPNRVGEELGVSSWITVDQQRIDLFAECTEDRQWIHVDRDRARRDTVFGTTIAHGYLVLSLLAPMVFEVLIEPAGIGQALNYGIDRVRFLAPVRAGARVRNRVKLVGTETRRDGRILLTTENAVEIEGEDKPALVATVLAVVSKA